MKRIFAELRPAIAVTIVLAIVCCGIYPLVVYGISQVLFRDKANGSLIVDSSGTVLGSRLIGQQFTAAKYFHPRPSAAGNGYDATNSSASNLGPTSSNLVASITQHVSDYRAENNLATNATVPADAVTASASGLDPHISVHNAELQAPRVAKARNLPVDKVLELVRANTDAPDLGIFGDPGVNVLKLNLDLDNVSGPSTAAR